MKPRDAFKEILELGYVVNHTIDIFQVIEKGPMFLLGFLQLSLSMSCTPQITHLKSIILILQALILLMA
jgi:hypothetical protein